MFINYCIIYYTNSYKPTLPHTVLPLFFVIFLLFSLEGLVCWFSFSEVKF